MSILRKNFKRHLDSLAEIFDLIDRVAKQEEVEDAARRAISLVVDELFTNMVKHDSRNPGDITVELQVEDETFLVRLIDRGAPPFDITKKPDPYFGASLDERKPGGLGIFLTKSVLDDVQYQYQDGTSTITLKKNLRKKNV